MENKGLDLIARQQPEFIDGYPTGNIYIGVTKEELTELEKELKALEIIKEKRVNAAILINSESLEEYNSTVGFYFLKNQLTQEEYDLLREVVLWRKQF